MSERVYWRGRFVYHENEDWDLVPGARERAYGLTPQPVPEREDEPDRPSRAELDAHPESGY